MYIHMCIHAHTCTYIHIHAFILRLHICMPVTCTCVNIVLLIGGVVSGGEKETFSSLLRASDP